MIFTQENVYFLGGKQQTDPPSIPISELFPDGNYPEGEIMKHPEVKDL